VLQCPLEHSSPAEQALPHDPQFCGSTPVSAHLPPHAWLPPVQAALHCPAEQNSPAAHAAPHAPQFAGSKVVLVQLSPHSVAPGHGLPPELVVMPEPLDVVGSKLPLLPPVAHPAHDPTAQRTATPHNPTPGRANRDGFMMSAHRNEGRALHASPNATP
jgi:hypothetical protein